MSGDSTIWELRTCKADSAEQGATANARTVLVRPPCREEVDAQQMDPQRRRSGRPAEQLHYAGERWEKLGHHFPTYVSLVDNLGQIQATVASAVVAHVLSSVRCVQLCAGEMSGVRRSSTSGDGQRDS